MKITLSPLVTEINGTLDRLSIYELNGQHVTRGHRIPLTTYSPNFVAYQDRYNRLYERYKVTNAVAKQGMIAGGNRDQLGSWAWMIQEQLKQMIQSSPYIYTDYSDITIPTPVNFTAVNNGSNNTDIFWDASGLPSDLYVGYAMWRHGSQWGVRSENLNVKADVGQWLNIVTNQFHNYECNVYFFKDDFSAGGRSSYFLKPRP